MRSGLRDFPSQTKEPTPVPQIEPLMGEVISAQNMRLALKRVELNKGAAGIDGMITDELRDYLHLHWRPLREALLTGAYRPQPVKRVEIPKPTGCHRASTSERTL